MPFFRVTKTAKVCISLAVLICIAYWHVLFSGFVFLDDYHYIVNNEHIRRGLSFEGIRWAMTATYDGNWFPLTWMSHMLDISLFGLWPEGHHFANLLYHILNSLLLLSLFQRLTGSLWRSTLVAALFALHPIHVESVAWVSEQKDLLSSLFLILTLLSYRAWRERPSTVRYLCLVFLYCCGLASKPMLVTLPYLLLLLDFWPLGRFSAQNCIRLIAEKLPLMMLSIVSCIVTFIVQRQGGAMGGFDRHDLVGNVSNAVINYLRYIIKMFWPRDLAVLYPYAPDLPYVKVCGAVFLLLAVSATALAQHRKRPYIAFGWFWYLISLVPVAGFVRVGMHSMADRYTYIPLIGLFVVLVWGVNEILVRLALDRMVPVVLGSSVLILSGIATWHQTGYWRNSSTLFEHTLAVTDDNHLIHNSLGLSLAVEGKSGEAEYHFREAIRIKPDFADAYYNLGDLYDRLGSYDMELRYLTWAVSLNPGFTAAYVNRGTVQHKLGHPDKAIEDFEHAARMSPDLAAIPYDLGNVWLDMRGYETAITHYDRAIAINPGFIEAYNGRASAFMALGRILEAERDTLTARELHSRLR